MQHSDRIWFYFWVSVAGVAYASLVPFRLKPIPLSEALVRFESIPYLSLGAQSRADWIANILLFLPLGCSLTAWVDRKPVSLFQRGFLFCLIWFFCLFIAVGIEFLQVFFPHRTVSLNDIIAEGLGALSGITLWGCFGQWGLRCWGNLRKSGEPAINAILVFYGLIFLSYSLFPFDFIVSVNELSWKISSGRWAFFLTQANGQGLLRTGISLLLETFSVIPFGVFFFRKRLNRKPRVTVPLLCGLAIGAIIESVQFFLVSGTSQGASVLAKTVGFTAGAVLPKYLYGRWIERIKAMAPKMVVMAVIPYAIVITYLNGWLTHRWISIDMGLNKLNYTMAIPFYYHYVATETVALLSVMLHAGIYGLIGPGVLFFVREKVDDLKGRLTTVCLAITVALIMESGKLFLNEMKPDFTNVLIAAGSAWAAFRISALAIHLPWLSFPVEEENESHDF
jgi:VanZ family protein